MEPRTRRHVWKLLKDGTVDTKKRLIMTMHRRWHHPPGARMCRLLRSADLPLATVELAKDVEKQCSECRDRMVVHRAPVASSTRPTQFNEVIAMDVIYRDGHKESILHVMCLAARLSAVGDTEGSKEPLKMLECFIWC